MSNINNAHLIHDHSTGRSSTRLHAPPGGGNSMGTSFGWSDEPVQPPKQSQRADPNAMSAPAPSAPAPRARKGDFVDNRIGAGVVAASNPAPANNNENASANAGPRGFGDTGAPAIKVHHAPGGKSSGNILGWN